MVIVEWQAPGSAQPRREQIDVGMRLAAGENFLFVVGDTKHGFVDVAAFPKASVTRARVEGTERGLPDGTHWSAIESERGANASYGDWASAPPWRPRLVAVQCRQLAHVLTAVRGGNVRAAATKPYAYFALSLLCRYQRRIRPGDERAMNRDSPGARLSGRGDRLRAIAPPTVVARP